MIASGLAVLMLLVVAVQAPAQEPAGAPVITTWSSEAYRALCRQRGGDAALCRCEAAALESLETSALPVALLPAIRDTVIALAQFLGPDLATPRAAPSVDAMARDLGLSPVLLETRLMLLDWVRDDIGAALATCRMQAEHRRSLGALALPASVSLGGEPAMVQRLPAKSWLPLQGAAYNGAACALLARELDETFRRFRTSSGGAARVLIDLTPTRPRRPLPPGAAAAIGGECGATVVAKMLTTRAPLRAPMAQLFWDPVVARFVDGDYLRVTVTAPAFDSFLYVDYYTREGYVVHLFPNGLESDNRMAAGARRQLGDPQGGGRFWRIGAPFGHELIVATASSIPMLRERRPQEAERAADFVPVFLAALAETARRGTAVAITLRQIETTAAP